MPASTLVARDLTVSYGPVTILHEVSLIAAPGDRIGVVGPNGTGKTTLLRALAGLARPTDGQVHWNGSPRRVGDPDWHAACLFQGHAAGWKDGLSATDNLRLQSELDGHRQTDRVTGLLARAGLARQARLPFGRLSAGQRRRLSLARLAGSQRPLWLLDEPTTALDTAGQQLFGELLDAHLARGGLAVVATHQPLPVREQPIELSRAGHAPR